MSDEHFIDVRFEFEPMYYDGVTYFVLKAVTQSASTLEPDEAADVTETLAQSDKWHIDVNAAILEALENKRTEL